MFASSYKILLLFILLSTSCSQRKQEMPNGHWVSMAYFHGSSYHTLEIHDSVLYVNKKCGACGEVVMRLRRIQDGQFEAMTALDPQSNYFEYSGKYFLGQHNDSLVLLPNNDGGQNFANLDRFSELFRDAEEYSYDAAFVRVDGENSLSDDPYYSPYEVIVDPVPLIDEEVAQLNYVEANMFVGKPKRSEQFAVPEDSVVIEVDGVFINLKDVPLWVSRHQDIVTPSEREEIVIRLNLDKKVTDQFRQRLIQAIRAKAPSARILEARLDTKKGEVFFVNTR